MMKTPAKMAALGIEVPHVEITATALRVTSEATDQDYARLDQLLEAVGGSVLFWWGDYLNHLRSARGAEYAEAKAASAYAPATLKQAAWVCRHVAQERRRAALKFSHHIEVAALSPTDQEIWLCRAEDEGWDHKELRAAIRRSKAVVQNGPEQAPLDGRAAKASEGCETFLAWYQAEAGGFTSDQREEWDLSLKPLVDDYLRRNPGRGTVVRLRETMR